MTRAKGAGSLYQRADGRWCAVVELGTVNGRRKRRVLTSLDREQLIGLLPSSTPKRTRAEQLAAARTKGTHTAAEVRALTRAATLCRYCSTPLNLFNSVQDHIVSLNRGGSDSIANIQIICWECNIAKGDDTEYEYHGETRPFRPLPRRRHWMPDAR